MNNSSEIVVPKNLRLYSTIIIVAALVIGVVSYYLLSRPPGGYNSELRDLDTVKNIIDSNQDVMVGISVNDVLYDKNGSCVSFGDFQSVDDCMEPNKETFLISVYYFVGVGDGMWRIVQVNFHSKMPQLIFDIISGEPHYDFLGFYASGGNMVLSEDDSLDWKNLFPKIYVSPSPNFCFYYPYDLFRTTCESKELEIAKEVYILKNIFFKEIGLSDNEVIVHAKWVIDEFIEQHMME